ncbi:sulfatase-like hydrolase/transferase [Qipengyuania sp. 1NDH17]|uniref:Sulfatase-like hydrolase/transferase n=1 Tax=Qipengyuania polymorpha TaxID=2867234 RepID=A0ABS7J2S8_9SPHN|nr:sulfatase-like hydrolase/transferase [Qipengyuania polymorpha]MBX7458635.1 sulfatase-like hydrolase/transferase [Qipengyuania polymorpha]
MATLPFDTAPSGKGSRKGPFASVERHEWRQFANWALVWLVLANLAFAMMWFVGAPPRGGEIMAAGALGLLVRNTPIAVRGLCFLAVMTYSVVSFIAGLFNLSVFSLLHSIRFFAEIKPTQSLDYIAGACLLLAIIILALWALRRPQGFTNIRLVLLAILATVALGQVDKAMGHGMRGHYARAADASTPFSSATRNAGVVPAALDGERHLMVIMVESLGTPVGNEDMSNLLFARYNDARVTNRFALSRGQTTYFNSTTAGEVRELCGRWGDYHEVLDKADDSCLPARLARAGYETRAYHSFTGAFFDRTQWYPNIGFQHQQFAEELAGRGARECGGVFPGVCDRDVPALLARDLKAADKPQFVYWLTVNSHLPVPPGMNLDVDRCERISPALAEDYPMICRQFALWDQMDRAIIAEITAADFPATDILIVGDHMPPYYDRHHRSQFAPDRVPWLLLKWKDKEGGEHDASAVVRKKDARNGAAG